jgi:hypothetical protein
LLFGASCMRVEGRALRQQPRSRDDPSQAE